MVPIQNELTLALEDAANEIPGAVERFLRILMQSTVFVPIKSEPKKDIPIFGQLETGDLGFLLSPGTGDEEILPIFSEPGYVAEWAEREIFYADCEFRKLIWVLGEDTVLHLNPGQEVGKEISRWEIEQLRRGEGAIPEIVAELQGGGESDILLEPAGPEYDPLKKKLLAVLEIATELSEAFLVVATEEEGGAVSPTLGLLYGEAVSPERREYFRAEFENCSREHLPSDRRMTILDDLDDENSPNWGLFADVNPFYVSTVAVDSGTKRGSIVHDLWKRIGNFRSDDDDET